MSLVDTVKVGDIFYTSWGYDQTNIDFYEIVGKTPKMVKYVAIGKNLEFGEYTDAVTPDPTIKGKKVRRAKVDDYGFSVSTFEHAMPWDGKPKHQTAPGYGH